ncbi:MAG: DNA-processing protein DprA [Thermodesulfobacteriota bacterium]
MYKDDLKYWIALGMVKGIGRGTYKALLDAFGEPRLVFESPDYDSFGGIRGDILLGIKGFKDWGRVEDEIALIDKAGVKIVTIKDKEYPAILRSTYDPPLYLYMKGDLDCLSSNAVAIVGARYPTHYGRRMAESIARDLAMAGVVVVSGMARGCDSAAHIGALSSKGATVAVLGTGVNIPYPKENKRLYDEIVESGLIISEYPMGTQPYPANFPQRNRIISGLSLGVLVVEASQRSGALITAGCALDCGREVFALPGNVTSMKSMGTNRLIKDGAKLVENYMDIMESLSLDRRPKFDGQEEDAFKEPFKGLEGDEKMIVGVLPDDEALTVDRIIQRTGLPTQRVLSILLDMELKGFIQQYPGKFFARRL